MATPAPTLEIRPLASPGIYLVRMAVFLILCGFLALILFEPLKRAFFGNPGLNALILGVLAIGIVLAVRQVARLFREIRWVNFVSGARSRTLAKPPILLAPVAALIAEREARARLNVATTRTLLDSIAARLDENRELVRYLAGLLVFLGLLGTFWGLIDTVNSVGRIIGSLRTGAEAGVMFDELKTALAAPLAGMGISFSASLFGLAGSLVLGFLDLQAGQAQNRFHNELEDWLAHATEPDPDAVPRLADGSPDIAGAIERLGVRLGDTGGREAALAMANLAEGVQALVQHVRSEQQIMRGWMDAQTSRDRELKALLERLAREKVV